MDRRLLEKYFRDECTEQELDQILDWFETTEGKEFLEEDIEYQRRAAGSGNLPIVRDIETQKLFSRIQASTAGRGKRNRWISLRVASILVIFTSLVALFYWNEVSSSTNQPEKAVQVVHTTHSGQHKILTFADGTVVRLNENSMLTVPEKMLQTGARKMKLNGEAYFEVASRPDSPFIVETDEATVEVLGTKFNVLAFDGKERIQVAVTEGKVALTSKVSSDTASALLTKNYLGTLRLSDNQIIIEKVDVRNYLSWMSNRLVYAGETLGQVSKQLEDLYDVRIEFETERLRSLELTADMPRTDLSQVIRTIANTFDIQYTQKDGKKIVWTE